MLDENETEKAGIIDNIVLALGLGFVCYHLFKKPDYGATEYRDRNGKIKLK